MEIPESLTLPDGVKSKPLRIDVTALGLQNWNIQFLHPSLDLTDDEPYTVSFWAKADRVRQLAVTTTLDKADYHSVGLNERVGLSTRWQEFSFVFRASRTAKAHNRLTFIMGDALGRVDLVGITLRPGSETNRPIVLSQSCRRLDARAR